MHWISFKLLKNDFNKIYFIYSTFFKPINNNKKIKKNKDIELYEMTENDTAYDIVVYMTSKNRNDNRNTYVYMSFWMYTC